MFILLTSKKGKMRSIFFTLILHYAAIRRHKSNVENMRKQVAFFERCRRMFILLTSKKGKMRSIFFTLFLFHEFITIII